MNAPFNLSVQDVKTHQEKYTLVDVREPHELKGPLGFIEEVILAPLSQGLQQFLDAADPSLDYVFICRSGVRSALACEMAHTFGLKAYNLAGGMIAWREAETKLLDIA